MNKKAIVGLLAIVLSGYCFAAGPAVVSHEQAAAEALENRNLAHDLWLYTFQACIQQDKPALHKIVHKLGQQTFAQPTNHLNYSARFVYEGCKQLLSDVWAFNGMCLSKSASVDEIVRVNNSWENSSKRCDVEISSPDLSKAEHPKEQTDVEWEAERRQNGESEENIELMKQIRRS